MLEGMAKSLMGALGINPDELQKTVQDFVGAVAEINERLKRLEAAHGLAPYVAPNPADLQAGSISEDSPNAGTG